VESITQTHVLRFKPGEDLKRCIQLWAKEKQIKAAVVVTCVGSLSQSNLRYANQQTGVSLNGFFEILALSGTISASAVHLHISIADEKGITRGGHLLDGNIIYTTAEIALAVLPEIEFVREKDPTYGYNELKVQKANQ